tara:strand:- start:21 stop:1031 length:1011 start_codon:yes stop_codon:yes gene_type:complete
LGGLARKATIIDEIRSEIGVQPIIVDAGNLFFKKSQPSVGIANDINKINAGVILEAFNEMGCDAFSVGENDLSNGLDYLVNLKNKANFPFISANIADSNNNLIFSPYIVIESGVNIGFVGLASKFKHSDVNVLDPFNSLENIIEEVRSKSDVVVLLFNANDDNLAKLQKSDLGVDLIIRSKSKKRSNDGGKKRIPAYSSGDRGKYLYRLDLKLSQSGLPITDITAQKNIIDNAKKRLERMKKGDDQINLKEFYKDDPQMLNRILGYDKQLELARQKLDDSRNIVELISYELGKTVLDKPNILKIIDKGKEKINLIKGPNMDTKGRLPGDPHHGHSH